MSTKVLIVLDGEYRFKEPAEVKDFTFITLVDTLTAVGMNVTRAYRGFIGANAVANGEVDIQNFNFASSVNLLEYDVIWLIGYDGRNGLPGSTSSSGAHKLAENELGALAGFMNAGGGVFATGDHDSIGADMCGHIPRVRAMRAWFGEGDGASPMPAGFPRNFPVISSGRADTVQKNPLGDYDLDNNGVDENHVYFENQSDSIPQPIVPTTTPAHPILRRNNGMDITVYPDHMHEGQTLGEGDFADSYYSHTLPAGVPAGFVEFPTVAGQRELPQVIAQGQVLEHSQRYGDSNNTSLDAAIATAKAVNTLTTYDGRKVGVGRIVTGATFHHYIDINLTGDTDINTPEEIGRVGPDAVKGQGFGYPGAGQTFADIKAVFINITNWLARPRPRINLILERSTFSQDEVNPGSVFNGALLVTVDGLKPSQFPNGPINDLTPSAATLQSWAPTVAMVGATAINITPIAIDSDAPTLPDKLQRFTFTYRISFVNENDFAFAEEFKNFQINAALTTPAALAALTDSAWLQLVKAANPFMLDLANGNATTWLSSDVRVFPVVAGETKFGELLPNNATKSQAYSFMQNLLANISVAEFESLAITQAESALSPLPTTTVSGKKVYNFAIARVRLNGQAVAANQVRVFFRIFTSQTTAALSYKFVNPNDPLEGYKKTMGANPIALPGVTSSGNEWLSFPFFAQNRAASPAAQTDNTNVKNISPIAGTEVSTFFGALIDNNLSEPYLQTTPISGGAPVSLSSLLMGEHQCLVAQIEYAGTPIPNGAKPSNSDKLAQRNLAISSIANPGITASRMALHTFELEATPGVITDDLLPDELMLEWEKQRIPVPEGTLVRIYLPSWDTAKVIALADRFYPRHNLEMEDATTLILPANGTSYVPLPRSLQRQTGIVMVDFPLGIKKGQRYDLRIRQISNSIRRVRIEPGRAEFISREEAAKLIARLQKDTKTKSKTAERKIAERGAFDLGDNMVLYTDLSAFDMKSDKAIIYKAPDPEQVAAAKAQEGIWRETIGAFQLGIPVSVKEDMLPYYSRLLSVFLWRLEKLSRTSRWYKTFNKYVELMINKVQALGGNPFQIPATPDGNIGIATVDQDDTGKPGDAGTHTGDTAGGKFFEPADDDWLGDSNGLLDPENAGALVLSGKVSGLLFDHFGDFEGFTLEAYNGRHLRFFSREEAILNIVKSAWLERYVVTVITVAKSSHQVRRVLIRGYT